MSKLQVNTEVWTRHSPNYRMLLECWDHDENGNERKYLAEAEIYVCGAVTWFKEGQRVVDDANEYYRQESFE